MHNIKEKAEEIKLLEEFVKKFPGHKKAADVLELLNIINKNETKNIRISRNNIIKNFSKQKDIPEATIHKWFNEFMSCDFNCLIDNKILTQYFLINYPFLIDDRKIVNWNKRNLCIYFEQHILNLQGFSIKIKIKETTAFKFIKEVRQNQDNLLEEYKDMNVLFIDYVEDNSIKRLKAIKDYILYYCISDITVGSKRFQANVILGDKESIKDSEDVYADKYRTENDEYLAVAILDTVCKIRNKRKIRGKLTVLMPRSRISKIICKFLKDIKIKSIEVNPKELELTQEDIEYSFNQIEEYKLSCNYNYKNSK